MPRKSLPQNIASAHQSRLNGSQANVEDLGYLFVGQLFDIAQNHGSSVRFGNRSKFNLNAATQFLVVDIFQRRLSHIRERLADRQ